MTVPKFSSENNHRGNCDIGVVKGEPLPIYAVSPSLKKWYNDMITMTL